MKNIILALTLCLPFILNGQDKNYPYSIMDWVNDNANDYQIIPPTAIDENLCGLINPVFGQNSSDMDGVFNDTQCGQCNNPQINADDFYFESDQQIGSICWVGYFFREASDCTPMDDQPFTIKYYADNGFLPGMELASFDVVPTPIQTGNIIGGAIQTVFTTEHPPVDFTAGLRYWVSIYTNISDPDGAPACDYAWDLSDEANVDYQGSAVTSAPPETPVWLASGSDYTFFLGSTAPIPTLSQWGIMVLSLLLIIIGVVSVKVPISRPIRI